MTDLVALISAIFLFVTCASVAQSGGENGPSDWGSDWNGGGSFWKAVGSGAYGGSQALSPEISGTSEAYFPSSILESADILIEEGGSSQYGWASYPTSTSGFSMAAPGGNQNIFWIVSRDGTVHWDTVNMPLYRYARMLLIPSASGSLILEKRYPSGYVRSYSLGYVRAHNQYRIWFYADTPGTQQMRYRVGSGPYSNVLTFYISGTDSIPQPTPPDSRPNVQIVTQAVDPATNRVYYSYNQEGRQVFRIKVLVTGPDKYRVRSVRYQLHPTFSPSEYTSTNPNNNFELELWTWGAFNMPITITTTDGRVYRYDYYFTFGDQLRDAQRRSVPFVQVR
jgi:hypothetical protein